LTFTGNATNNNNRMDLYSYDSAGNLLNDGVHSYFYDAENHLIQVDGSLPYCTSNGASGSAATACYYYDASGRRVHRTGYTNDTCDNTGKRDYIFDLAGRVIVENNVNGTACDIQVYAGERHFGRQGGGSFFYHSDWLGTVRLINSDQNPTYGSQLCTSLPFGDGLTCNSNASNVWHFIGKERDYESNLDNFGARYDADFYPYGGERTYTNSCPTANNYKFEGKERDTETGNDDFGARYYSNRFGRWLSADWSNVPVPVPYANLTNPQTLNLYAMVSDDPETSADLDGHIRLASQGLQAPEGIDGSTGELRAEELTCSWGAESCESTGEAQDKAKQLAQEQQAAQAAQQAAQRLNETEPESLRHEPSTLHKTYKWYQFATKWWDHWNEAKTLKSELEADTAIYKQATDVVFDPGKNHNSPVYGLYAEIARLEKTNLLIDGFRSADKALGAVAELGVDGATADSQFNSAGRIRDANNMQIDRLLGEAADRLKP